MVKHLLHHQIDTEKWDALIYKTPNADPFLLSSWLNLVEPSWSALVANDYEAVLPLFIKKRWFWTFFDLPNFIQKIGVCGDGSYLDEIRIELLKQENKLDYICFTTDPLLYDSSSKTQNRCHQILTLKEGVRFPTKVWGRNIRRAEASGLTDIRPLSPLEFIKALKAELKEKSNPYSDSDYVLLQRLAEKSIEEGFGYVEGITDSRNQILCGQFYLYIKGKIYLVACCSNEIARQNSLLHYILFCVINKGYTKDMSMRVHFGGSNIPVIADFNKNFGAEDEDFVLVYQNRLPFWLRFFKHV